jgi:hypothetical protein
LRCLTKCFWVRECLQITSNRLSHPRLFTAIYHHNALFTGHLLDSTINVHRLGISDIRTRTSSIVILLYSSCRAYISSSINSYALYRILYSSIFFCEALFAAPEVAMSWIFQVAVRSSASPHLRSTMSKSNTGELGIHVYDGFVFGRVVGFREYPVVLSSY